MSDECRPARVAVGGQAAVAAFEIAAHILEHQAPSELLDVGLHGRLRPVHLFAKAYERGFAELQIARTDFARSQVGDVVRRELQRRKVLQPRRRADLLRDEKVATLLELFDVFHRPDVTRGGSFDPDDAEYGDFL
jgi:hypothetical protein